MVKLKVEDLHVEVDGKEVLKGINLEINSGEIHALMGPNGSGKTSLSLAIMGHPKYKITKGRVLLDNEDITNLETHEKVKRGLFLAFQNPVEITEVRTATLLTAIINKFYTNSKLSVSGILNILKENTKAVGLSESILNRGLFEGFSGGEKKRMEILQMLLIKPSIAILDEPDSGVDIDGLRLIASVINKMRAENNTGFLIITHYRRILDHISADRVHVLYKGKIYMSGGMELAKLIDEKGYEGVLTR